MVTEPGQKTGYVGGKLRFLFTAKQLLYSHRPHDWGNAS